MKEPGGGESNRSGGINRDEEHVVRTYLRVGVVGHVNSRTPLTSFFSSGFGGDSRLRRRPRTRRRTSSTSASTSEAEA